MKRVFAVFATAILVASPAFSIMIDPMDNATNLAQTLVGRDR